MKRVMLDAIEYDIVHELTRGEHKHPLCVYCGSCTLGVSVDTVDTSRCPLCGADRSPGYVTPYNGAVNQLYGCGTVINICLRQGAGFITTIATGDECYRISDAVVDII